jgi:signal peptidase I
VSYLRKFNLFSLSDTFQGIFFPYLLLWKINKDANLVKRGDTNWSNVKDTTAREHGDHLVLALALPVVGHALALGANAVMKEKPGDKSRIKDWGDSFLFALLAASIIRTYVFEPFNIPTGSMEKTMMVGDFLFVNKMAYGSKVPVTPFSFPLVHNTIPYLNVKSYLGIETCNYTRLPGFGQVQRNDVVVFNYPSGDTAVYDPRIPDGLMGHDYHGLINGEAMYLGSVKYGQDFEKIVENFESLKQEARRVFAEDKITHANGSIVEHFGVISRPVDKRENYIKRCVGLPGDVIEVKKSVLFVNGRKAWVSPTQNLQYIAKGFTSPGDEQMLERYGLEIKGGQYRFEGSVWRMDLTKDQLFKLKKDYPKAEFLLADVEKQEFPDSLKNNPIFIARKKLENLSCFPKDFKFDWTMTNFGKVTIPKKGVTIAINKDNIAIYRRVIQAYERHTLVEKGDQIIIDGKVATTYTFGMNYYWLMGDNRYNSADSRVWGFVPEDHVVGRASLVWFSKSPYAGVRTERIFKIVK